MEERVEAAVGRMAAWRGEELMDGLLVEARAFGGPDGFEDDVCLVCVEFS